MPTIELKFLGEHEIRIVDAMCGLNRYHEGPEEPGGKIETRQDFCARMIRNYLVQQVSRWEGLQAKREAIKGLSKVEVS